MVTRSVLVLTLLGSVSVPAGAVPGPTAAPPTRGLSTPQLLERAVARGRVDRATADLYLAHALGDHRRVPDRFVSAVPWDGTLPLLHLRERVKRMPPGPARAGIREALHPVACDGELAGPDLHESTYFHIHYDDPIDPDLDIEDYGDSLDVAWETEVIDFGWAAPPLGIGFAKYPVVVTALGPGLYGFVATMGPPGNNVSTPWNDVDAFASCMVLNEDYSSPPFPSPPQASLDATTAHEFNHSIQFGYGVITGPNAADDVFIEGGATWMEDEVFDDSDDNYNYLWPAFTKSMGEYLSSPLPHPYSYWVVFRALTERFGTGSADMGEEVMQGFWEAVSQSVTSVDLVALGQGLAGKGTTLPEAYHAAAVALRFNQPCGGGWTAPYCLEEGPLYVAAEGAPPLHGAIAAAGASFSGAIEDNYALNWVALPSVGPYPVALRNSSEGGALRATVACATPAGPKLAPLSAVAGPGEDRFLSSFDPSGCLGAPVAVITNESQTAPNPTVSTPREYVLFASLAPKDVKLKAKPRRVDRGERTRLKARVSPCAGHEGDAVEFFRRKKKIATKRTNGSCVATKKVRIRKTSVFRAVSPAQDEDHSKATSAKVKVRVRQA